MKQIRFLGHGNGGDQSKIDALFLIYPYLNTICDGRKVSVLYLYPPTELPTYSYSSCAVGYDCKGEVYLIKNRAITAKRSWEEMRQRRRTLGLCDPFSNSPQAELSGDEEACVLVQLHYAEGDEKDSWISLCVFMCPPEKAFRDFPVVRTWLAEISVRAELREAGFTRW